MCRINVMSEVKSQSDTNAEIGPVAKLAEDEEYDEIISLYDFIDEQAVRDYEGLDQAILAQTYSHYAGLAAGETADTRDSTEHVDDADNDDQDQVSKPNSCMCKCVYACGYAVLLYDTRCASGCVV